MTLWCMIFGHRRSARRAWLGYGAEWRSVCRFCGEPMIRVGPGRWRLMWKVRKAAQDDR